MRQEEVTVEGNFVQEALQRTRRTMWYVLLFSLCINILLLAMPIYSLQVLDRVISSASIPTLINLTIIIVIAFIFYGAFSLIRNYILAQIGEWLDTKVSAKLLAIGVTQNSLGSNTSASQHLRDMQTVRNFVAGSGITSLFDAPWSVIYIIVIYMINPVLGLVSLFGGLILFGFAILNEILTRKPYDSAHRAMMKTMEIADASTRSAEAIEAMGMMTNIRKRWAKENTRYQELQAKAGGRANLLLHGSKIIRMLLQIAITGIGAWLAINNQISVGGMIASSILSGRALAPFEAAIGIWKSFINARDSYARLGKAITKLPTLRGNMRLPEPDGVVSVENVFFGIPGNLPILKGISFKLAAGEMMGIIGPSAAGKSTLAKLIVGILPPTGGAARLDGAEIFKWNREFLGPYIGYLPQQVELFSGTILDNIARLDPEPDQEKVLEAAQLACVHDMILRLPEGYETVIRPGNATLSPGQRQRIGLARALYGKPKFLVLDEPNINLDGEGEQALISALNNIKKMKITCILVAHRPNLVNGTDKVLILQDGRVKEFGPTKQVLGKYLAPTLSEPGN